MLSLATMRTWKLFLIGAVAALSAVACTTNTNTDAENVGEAREAFVTYANPSALVSAIQDDGATWGGGALMIADVAHYGVLAGGVWSLSTEGGDTMGRGVYRVLSTCTLDAEPGEYQWTIVTPAEQRYQVIEVEGAITLGDP